MEGAQPQQDQDAPLPPEDPVPDLPDFDLEDEEVRSAIVEATGYYRGYWHGLGEREVANRKDSRVLMEFYLKTGLVDSLEAFLSTSWDHHPVIAQATDENDNIKYLAIRYYGSLPYRVPAQVANFEHLRFLDIRGKCQRISNSLRNCSLLEDLEMYDVEIEEPFLLPPGLFIFLLEDMNNMQCTENVITSLKLYPPLSRKTPHEGLERIHLNSCQLVEHHVEDVLFNAVPNFPNLEILGFPDNKIESLATVSSRLRSMAIADASFISTNFPSLKNFYLSGNPLMTRCLADAKQNVNACDATNPQNSVIQLLTILPSITDINCERHETDIPQIKYQLDLNRARTALVTKANYGQGDAPIPLSFWPRVLKKAVQYVYRPHSRLYRTVGNFDGVYYLLRHGPALCANFDATENKNRKKIIGPQKKRKRSQDC